MLKIVPSSQLTTLPLIQCKVMAAIPCFNTQESISDIVSRTRKYVDEVIVVDDGSTDSTAEVAKRVGATVISHGMNKGYGEAMKSCFKAAQANAAEVLVILDGDGQHNPDEIPRLLTPVFQEGAKLVIGSRFLSIKNGVPLYRKLGISLITFLWNIGSKVKVSDAQCGFRVYSKQVFKYMNFTEKGMSASIEILEEIRKKKSDIREIPVTCSYENANSHFTFQALRHGISVAFSVLRIRIKNIFTGSPDIDCNINQA